MPLPPDKEQLRLLKDFKLSALQANINAAVLGCEQQVELLLVALLARGRYESLTPSAAREKGFIRQIKRLKSRPEPAPAVELSGARAYGNTGE